jgi:hypothetical protein
MNFKKYIMVSIPAFVDARIRVLKGMYRSFSFIGDKVAQVTCWTSLHLKATLLKPFG